MSSDSSSSSAPCRSQRRHPHDRKKAEEQAAAAASVETVVFDDGTSVTVETPQLLRTPQIEVADRFLIGDNLHADQLREYEEQGLVPFNPLYYKIDAMDRESDANAIIRECEAMNEGRAWDDAETKYFFCAFPLKVTRPTHEIRHMRLEFPLPDNTWNQKQFAEIVRKEDPRPFVPPACFLYTLPAVMRERMCGDCDPKRAQDIVPLLIKVKTANNTTTTTFRPIFEAANPNNQAFHSFSTTHGITGASAQDLFFFLGYTETMRENRVDAATYEERHRAAKRECGRLTTTVRPQSNGVPDEPVMFKHTADTVVSPEAQRWAQVTLQQVREACGKYAIDPEAPDDLYLDMALHKKEEDDKWELADASDAYLPTDLVKYIFFAYHADLRTASEMLGVSLPEVVPRETEDEPSAHWVVSCRAVCEVARHLMQHYEPHQHAMSFSTPMRMAFTPRDGAAAWSAMAQNDAYMPFQPVSLGCTIDLYYTPHGGMERAPNDVVYEQHLLAADAFSAERNKALINAIVPLASGSDSSSA